MSDIRDFVMGHPLFCHHDHHASFQEFDAGRDGYDHKSLLGYATADLVTAAGPGVPANLSLERMAEYWPYVRTTGYGRAVDLTSRECFGLEYTPDNWDEIAAALRDAIHGRTAQEVYEHYVHEVAQNRWTIQDGAFRLGTGSTYREDAYPNSYAFAFRIDGLLAMDNPAIIGELEQHTGLTIYTLDHLVDALNLAIDEFQDTGRLAAIKIGMAYQRDLVVGDPTHAEAEAAFVKIRNRKSYYGGIRQYAGAVDAVESRRLGDYMFHRLIQRAADEGLPVQIHTGYLAGNWAPLTGIQALHLIPILDKYRTVRFDLFHASWPWASELGAIAKNWPNVWADLCWAWTMNPAESERALSEWLDGVPHNKTFAYGADTRLPWCNVGYSIQAKIGVARVLENKIAAGYYSEETAREVAGCLLLHNGEEFFGLG